MTSASGLSWMILLVILSLVLGNLKKRADLIFILLSVPPSIHYIVFFSTFRAANLLRLLGGGSRMSADA